MPWASVSMLDGPGGTGKIIHIIVQDQDGQNNNMPIIYQKTTSLFISKSFHFHAKQPIEAQVLLINCWPYGVVNSTSQINK